MKRLVRLRISKSDDVFDVNDCSIWIDDTGRARASL